MRRPGRGIAAALAVGACSGEPAAPDAAPPAMLEIVGHADLGARGMNAALAVAGDTVYVGSRIDGAGIAIVDVSDPAAPEVVGEIGAPDQGLVGMSSRELRAVPDLDLLVVLDLQCSPDLHGCGEPAAERESFRLYDISDRRAPALVGRYEFTFPPLRPYGPHEFFLWRDPEDPARILLHTSTPPAPSYEVIDVSDPTTPVRVAQWDVIGDGGLRITVTSDNILHSVSVSDDGRTGYFSHLQGGVFAVDLGPVADGELDPAPTLLTDPTAIADWSPPQPAGPHSAVPVPGRDLLVVTDEVYPPPFGTGCPYGWLRLVDISDPGALEVTGSLKLDENRPSFCDTGPPETATFSAHNATVTAHLALVSWHSAGLQAVDLTDPAEPARLAELRPEPLASVTNEDPGIGGDPVLMWSYPVVQDGLIYVVDIRNGLYIVRYTGPYADELEVDGPLEGNSNVGW